MEELAHGGEKVGRRLLVRRGGGRLPRALREEVRRRPRHLAQDGWVDADGGGHFAFYYEGGIYLLRAEQNLAGLGARYDAAAMNFWRSRL